MGIFSGRIRRLLLPLVIVLIFAVLSVYNYSRDQADVQRLDGFSFIVMSDSQGSSSGVNEKVLGALMDNIKELSNQPRFILFAGDMVHGNSKDLPRELERWKRIMQGYTYFPAIGNHEKNESLFSNTFGSLPNDQLPGYRRTVYYFDYGNSRFIVLNSIRRDAARNYVVDANQRVWLEKLLSSSNKTHNFVMLHVMPYPVGRHYGRALDANPNERDALWAIFDRHRVSAVFVGHEHNYNRRLVDSSFSSNYYKFYNEIYQITAGGAGGPLDSAVRDKRNVVVGPVSTHHYVLVEVRGGSASFSVFDLQNRLIDSFKIER